MKHDMFKQMTIDLLPALVFFGLPSLVYYFMFRSRSTFVPIMSLSEFISFNSYKDLYNSVIGRSLTTVLGYFMFYQVLQPFLVNYLPYF